MAYGQFPLEIKKEANSLVEHDVTIKLTLISANKIASIRLLRKVFLERKLRFRVVAI